MRTNDEKRVTHIATLAYQRRTFHVIIISMSGLRAIYQAVVLAPEEDMAIFCGISTTAALSDYPYRYRPGTWQ